MRCGEGRSVRGPWGMRGGSKVPGGFAAAEEVALLRGPNVER